MIRRRKPLARSTKPIAKSGKAIRKSPFENPEFRRLVRIVRKRSRGICEMQVACDGNPATGWPHHKSYGPAGTWRKHIVAPEELVAACFTCHDQHHRAERAA